MEPIKQLLEPPSRRAMAEESTARISPNSTQKRAGAGMIKQPDPVTWVLVRIIGVWPCAWCWKPEAWLRSGWDGYSSDQGTTERNRTMTFWLFRKPRLYRILAPMEPQPRPAPRRVQYQFDRVGEQFDEADPAVARRAAPTEEEEERNRDGLAVPRSEGPRSTAVDVQ